MPLGAIGRRYRGLQRLRRVIQILVKHGLGHVVERLDLRQHLPLPAKWKGAPAPREPIASSRALAQRATSAMQELGPTFVKLGQFLSTRPDILPPVYIEEFSKLQDSVQPFAPSTARAIIEQQLGGKVEQFFKTFQDQPIASGSMAQVHLAETADGRAVVVKVQRPGISKVIQADLELLEDLATRVQEYIPESRVMRPRMIVEELGRHLRRELDFLHEASATQRFHKAFEESEDYHSPEVLWELTTASVLTLERLSGKRISEFLNDSDRAVKKQLAARLFDLYMKQFFEMGFFHADPHPGNILVDEKLRINIIDFGLTGYISDELQGHLGTAILAVNGRDVDLLIAVLEHLGVMTDDTDVSELRGDIMSLLDTYMGMPLGRMDVQQTFAQITSAAQRNALFLPREFVLMGKALVTVGGLAKALDPEFEAAGALGPYMKLVVRRKFSTQALTRSASWLAFHGLHLLKEAPADLRRIIRKIVTGGLSVNFQHKGLEKLIFDLDRASNRLAFSIIVAALVIASSMILNAGKGPLVIGMPVLGIVGYLLAALLGLWLIVAILRSGRL